MCSNLHPKKYLYSQPTISLIFGGDDSATNRLFHELLKFSGHPTAPIYLKTPISIHLPSPELHHGGNVLRHPAR